MATNLKVGPYVSYILSPPCGQLHDYYAAAALQALNIQAHVAAPAAAQLAKSAHEIAGAMIKERENWVNE